jgi:acyl carrier protein
MSIRLAGPVASKVTATTRRVDRALIASGVVDSLRLMTLVTFVEEEFGLEVADEEIVPANFGTIGAIGSLIRGKEGAVP